MTSLVSVALLPLVMGFGYEMIRLAGRHDNWFTRVISAPGMWLQRITVLEPTDDMIECAIAAFNEVLPENEKPVVEESAQTEEQTPSDSESV